MRFTRYSLCASLMILVLSSVLNAQQPAPPAGSSAVVPRLVNFSGRATDVQGKPVSGIAGITFAVYKGQNDGAPLWTETQNVQADSRGNYTVQLGATKSGGLPLELFTSGEARWLGVRVNGGEEQARILLLSVPYALKAADAETLGGKPLSAFQLAAPPSGNSSMKTNAPPTEQSNEIRCAGGAACKASFIPRFSTNGGSAKVNNSIISQAGTTVGIAGNATVSGNFGASTVAASSPGAAIAGTMSGNNVNLAAVTGVATATGNGNTFGVEGVSSTNNGSGTAGIASGTSAAGVFGQNTVSGYGVLGWATGSSGQGVRGEAFGSQASNGLGPDGVDGFAHSSGGSGVAGFNDDPNGTGVYGNSPGWAFHSAGNAQQELPFGGWVKAMVYVNAHTAPYTILRCFNSALAGAAASTPPCGFILTELQFGLWVVDFGYPVNDRFLSTVGSSVPATVLINACGSDVCGADVYPSQILVSAVDSTTGQTTSAYFYLIVF